MTVDNGQIFKLVNDARLELKSDIAVSFGALSQQQGKLEKKFDELEAGRLTRAEANINELRVKDAVLTTKVIVLVGVIASAGTIILNVVLDYFFHGGVR